MTEKALLSTTIFLFTAMTLAECVVAHTRNSSTQREDMEFKANFKLLCKFEVGLGYRRPYLKKQKTKDKQSNNNSKLVVLKGIECWPSTQYE